MTTRENLVAARASGTIEKGRKKAVGEKFSSTFAARRGSDSLVGGAVVCVIVGLLVLPQCFGEDFQNNHCFILSQ
jgi:hypothetical protein